tara:strand:+ start:874 stop:987 length:114 start_codon:yes stop_codon:yes gene_type:complete
MAVCVINPPQVKTKDTDRAVGGKTGNKSLTWNLIYNF